MGTTALTGSLKLGPVSAEVAFLFYYSIDSLLSDKLVAFAIAPSDLTSNKFDPSGSLIISGAAMLLASPSSGGDKPPTLCSSE